MNTIAFILAGVILCLVIMSKIPGMEYLVKPIIDLLFGLLKVIAENIYSWTVWLVKALMSSHLEVFRNLIQKAEDIDPSQVMRNQEKKS